MKHSSYEIRFDLPEQNFEPGEKLKGNVVWNLDKPPKSIILNVGWYTEGRGTEDSCIEYEQQWDTESLTGSETFSLVLPPAPYSFAGKLIELIWYLSAEVKKGNWHTRANIVVAPGKTPVKLI